MQEILNLGKLNKTHKFVIANGDTDSIMFAKPDGSEFSKEEREFLLQELNSNYPELIQLSDDGYYPTVVVLKAKNYVLELPDGSIQIKGSGLKDNRKEPALLEFLQVCIQSLIDGEKDLKYIYNKYVREAMNIKDINRWAIKKTITKAIFESERANEEKVRIALDGIHIQEGDKVYLYTAKPILIPSIVKGELQYYKDGSPKMREDSPLAVIDRWKPGREDKVHYIERVHSCLTILKNLVIMDEYPKYHIKANRELLEKVLQDG